jgi:hypothetical protein
MNTQQDHEFDAGLHERLEILRDVPARNPEAAARGRAKFLSGVRQLSMESSVVNKRLVAQAVPLPAYQRFNNWLNSLFKVPSRRQRFSLAIALATLILTLALLFGGAGATVFAAQSSLPSDFLYPVKVLSEDVLLDLTNNPQARFDLLLDFSDRRVNEISALAAQGKTVPGDVISRFEAQDDEAFLLLINMDASKMPDELLKAKIHKRDQDRLLGQTQTNAPDQGVMLELRNRLQWQYRLLEEGEDNPQTLQQLLNAPINSETEPLVAPDMNEETPRPGDCSECTPVYGGSGPGPGPGPSNQGEITQPTEGYGPGPGPGQMAPPTQPPGNGNGEVKPSGPPVSTPVPGEGGSGSGGSAPSPATNTGGGSHNSGGGSGKP